MKLPKLTEATIILVLVLAAGNLFFCADRGVLVDKFRKPGKKEIIVLPVDGAYRPFLFIDDEDFVFVIKAGTTLIYRYVSPSMYRTREIGDFVWISKTNNTMEDVHDLKAADGYTVRDNAMPTRLWRKSYYDNRKISGD